MTTTPQNETSVQVNRCAELMKAVRVAWMTRPELARHLTCSELTVSKLAETLEDHGILVSRRREKRTGGAFGGGFGPIEFSLSPRWKDQ